MKKLLSLLSVISIIGTATVSVTSCGKTTTTNPAISINLNPREIIFKIEQALKGQGIELSDPTLNPNVGASEITKERIIDAIVKKAQLFASETQTLSVNTNNPSLVPETPVNIKITSTVKENIATGTIKVTLAKLTSEYIKDQIKNTNIQIASSVNVSTDQDKKNAILTQVNAINKDTFKSNWLKYLDFAQYPPLNSGVEADYTLQINIPNIDQTTLLLKVIWEKNDAQKLLDKITTEDLTTVFNINPDITNLTTQINLQNELQILNPTLTTSEAQTLQFKTVGGVDLSKTASVKVIILIKKLVNSPTKEINVQISNIKAQGILDKINNIIDYYVPASTPEILQNPFTKNAILKSIQQMNPNNSFNEFNLQAIELSGNNLQPNQKVTITLSLKDNASANPVTKTINVILNINPAQTIINKINNKNLTIAFDSNPNIIDSQTILRIKDALVEDNPTLNISDTNLMTFSTPGNILSYGDNEVTLTVKIQSSPYQAKTQINVNLPNFTSNEATSKISDKDFSVSLPPTSSLKTSDAVVKKAIMDNIKSNNTNLSDYFISLIKIDKNVTLSFQIKIQVPFTILTPDGQEAKAEFTIQAISQ